MRRFLAVLGIALLALAAIVLVRAARFTPRQPVDPSAAAAELPAADPEVLAGAIRFRTVSSPDGTTDTAAFLGLHRYLDERFPRATAAMRKEVVGGYSLLYTWQGADPALEPALLLSHMDVVPVEPGTEGRWTRQPFAGSVADGHIWGRGALDDKIGVVGLLAAAERLAAQGFRPRRTLMFAFGHDEETGGSRGAAALAALVQSRHPRVAFVMDEGSVIAEGVMPGVARPIALVGVAEKSTVSVELVAEGAGGHSSMPPPHSAVGVLARAIGRLEERQMPARLAGVARDMFDEVGREMPFGRRVLFANLWLFGPLVERALASSPTTNAMIRTTTAVTMMTGSPRENVLPITARAVVNFRVLPGDRVADVLAHVREVVDDTAVKVRALGEAREPSPVSPGEGPAFETIGRAVRALFPSAVVVPYLMVAATDTRHYEALSPNVYRFLPALAGPADISRLHGTDERISVENWSRAVAFYERLLALAGEGQ